MEELNRSIDELVDVIINSNEYQNVIEIKKKMDTNKELKELINEVKTLQKKYVKNNYDSELKEELEKKEKELNDIPIYAIYNENLDKVNEMINLVKDELNDYFYKKLNPKD